MKNNIVIISSLKDYKNKLAKKFADKLDMHYVDVDELMKFNLVNINKAIESAGKSYVEKLENKLLKSVSTYNNTVITFNHSLLNVNNNLQILKDNCLLIFLKFDLNLYLQLFKKQKYTTQAGLSLEEKVFKERQEYLQKASHITVDIKTSNINNNVGKIITAIKKFYN